MGGFSINETDREFPENELGLANHEKVSCFDDHVREEQARFLAENSDIDASCKQVSFLQELWKNESKLSDLMTEVTSYTELLSLIVESLKTGSFPPALMNLLKKDWPGVVYQFQNYNVVLTASDVDQEELLRQEKIPYMKNPATRLRARTIRCSVMIHRVIQEIIAALSSKRIKHKKTLHPDLSPDVLVMFLERNSEIITAVNVVIRESQEQQWKLLELFEKKEEQVKKCATDHDDTIVLQEVYKKQWKAVQQYQETTLDNFSFCIYSCGYRPLITRVSCSVMDILEIRRFGDRLTRAYEFDGNGLNRIKQFRMFYNAVFKTSLTPGPSTSLYDGQMVMQISSFLMSKPAVRINLHIILVDEVETRVCACQAHSRIRSQ